jgi:hypothetical protein
MLCKNMHLAPILASLFLLLTGCSNPAPQEKAVTAQAPATPVKSEAAKPKLPEDVAIFIEKREGCDHFRGEEAYDDERGRFINDNLERLCTGSDARLAALKAKYADSAHVMGQLGLFEEAIESPAVRADD